MAPPSPLTDPRGLLMSAVDKALRHADATAGRRVDDLRREHPHDTPHHTVERLERQFLHTVTATGAGTGAVAAAPGVGLPLAVGASGGDMAAFLTAAATYVLALARIHQVSLGDIDVDGLEARRTLLFGVLLGNAGAKVITNAASRTGAQWARALAGSMSVQLLRTVNRRLGGLIVRRLGPRFGLLTVGKLVPLGVGAALGGSGNYYMAKQVVAASRDAFGEPPAQWSAGAA